MCNGMKIINDRITVALSTVGSEMKDRKTNYTSSSPPPPPLSLFKIFALIWCSARTTSRAWFVFIILKICESELLRPASSNQRTDIWVWACTPDTLPGAADPAAAPLPSGRSPPGWPRDWADRAWRWPHWRWCWWCSGWSSSRRIPVQQWRAILQLTRPEAPAGERLWRENPEDHQAQGWSWPGGRRSWGGGGWRRAGRSSCCPRCWCCPYDTDEVRSRRGIYTKSRHTSSSSHYCPHMSLGPGAAYPIIWHSERSHTMGISIVRSTV